MKSSLRRLKTLIPIMFLFISSTLASTSDPNEPKDRPWLVEVPCVNTDKLKKRIDVSFEAVICVEFEELKLQQPKSGETTDLKLNITSYVDKHGRNPLITKPPSIENPGRFPGVIITTNGAPRRSVRQFTSSVTYSYTVTIDQQVKPTLYNVEFSTSENPDDRGWSFQLPFAPLDGKSIFQLTDKSQKTLSCWTGANCGGVRLNLVNSLPHYNFQITNILVTTEPVDLLEHNATTTDTQIRPNLTDQSISVATKPKSISLPQIFAGFGTSPKTILTIYFKDDYGREFNKDFTVGLEMKPNYLILAVTLLLGAIIGTLVRIDLQRLQRAGLITRRQKIAFALTTFGSGVLVCLVALFANLKLSVFEAQDSYSAWDPKILFLMGFVGTIGGIPILYALLKLPPPKTENTSKKPKQR